MIYLLAMLILGVTNSFADTTEPKFKELQQKLDNNMSIYCSKGVVAACNAKKEIDNPGSVPVPAMNAKSLTDADKADIIEMSKKMKSCGEDITCLQKLSDEQINKQVSSKEAKCKSGSQEDCFWIEHLKLTNELQNSL